MSTCTSPSAGAAARTLRRVRAPSAAVVLLLALGTRPAAAQAPPASPGGVASLRPYSVAISVRDLERSIAWYRDNLGFRLELQRPALNTITREGIASEGAAVAILERNGFRIELLQARGAVRDDRQHLDPPRHLGVLGVKNLVFQVDDLAAANRELRARGVPLLWESVRFPEMNGVRVTMLRDGEDNLISLWQTVDAPPPAAAPPARPLTARQRMLEPVEPSHPSQEEHP